MQGNQIEHLFSTTENNAMLVPYGLYKNAWILNMKPGDYFYTLDDVAVEIIDKMVIPVKSPIANCMSMLLYGMPIETVFNAMFGNWGYDIQSRNIILIIYKKRDD